ncbi:MAG: hypothetical protein WCS77_05505 [Elusimicrobiaceae bacterium]
MKKCLIAVLAVFAAPVFCVQTAPAAFPSVFCESGAFLAVRNTEVGVTLDFAANDPDNQNLIDKIQARFSTLADKVEKAGGLDAACKDSKFPKILCAPGAELDIQDTDAGVIIMLNAQDNMDSDTVNAIHEAFRPVQNALAVSGGDAGNACRNFNRRAVPSADKTKTTGSAAAKKENRETIKESDSQEQDFIDVNDK